MVGDVAVGVHAPGPALLYCASSRVTELECKPQAFLARNKSIVVLSDQLQASVQPRSTFPAPLHPAPEMAPAKKSSRAAAAAVPAAGETPDVTFHKRMTAGKRALAASSPLAHLLPDGGVKRAREPAAADAQPAKRARPDDPAAERAVLQETRRARKRAKKVAAKTAAEDGGVAGDVAGVVYVGHVPHGFFEKQMRGFFAQFGEVTRLRLSRSKKTARSRGFAFVEFANAEVAGIAAAAMDGYLMHGRALVAKFVAPDDVHPATFNGADRVFRRIPWASIERKRNIDAARDPEKLAARASRVADQHKKTQERLAALGIDYKFPTIPTVESAGGKDATLESADEKPVEGTAAAISKNAVSEGVADAAVTPKSKPGKKAKTAPESKSLSKAKATPTAKDTVARDDCGISDGEEPEATPKTKAKSSRKAKSAGKSKAILRAETDKDDDTMVDGEEADATANLETRGARNTKSAAKAKSAPKARVTLRAEAIEDDDSMSDGEEVDVTPKPKAKGEHKAKSAAKAKSTPKAEVVDDDNFLVSDGKQSDVTPKASAKALRKANSASKAKATANAEAVEADESMLDGEEADVTPKTSAKASRKAKSALKAKATPRSKSVAGDDTMVESEKAVATTKARSAAKVKATPRAKSVGKARSALRSSARK